MNPAHGEVTLLLRQAQAGEPSALEQVIPLVYDDLRALARGKLRRESGPRTLTPTALVHEAYLKLASGAGALASDRPHFLAIAARAMRQVLVDQARRRNSAKRGGGWAKLNTLGGAASEIGAGPELDPETLLMLDRALDGLDERQRRVVECRFFAGMEESAIAVALGVTERTVRRDWVKARAWLYRALYETAASGPEPQGSAAEASTPGSSAQGRA